MASDTTPLLSGQGLAKGDFHPSGPNDLRSPCPMINSLANHGYLPRDGRNVRAEDLVSAMHVAGLAPSLITLFVKPIFLENQREKKRTFLGNLWYMLWHPWAIVLSKVAMRQPGQVDAMGKEVLNLDQLALPGAVEHDISLSRRDFGQGDNCSPQPDLIKKLLESSSDGGNTITVEDLAALRKRRIAEQVQDNPTVKYGFMEHELACGEIGLILDVLGDGKKVPVEFVRALFQEERLPLKEGWKHRSGWGALGAVELIMHVRTIRKIIGINP